MKVHLPVNSFSFFKVASGTLFLVAAIISPLIATYSFIVALAIGRAHSLGAWLAMWRAGKLNWRYVTWMGVMIICVSFWGLKLVTLGTLSLITYALFTIHFLFDEFDLQEERRTFHNILASISPLILMFLLLGQQYLGFPVSFGMLVAVAVTVFAVECIYLSEITWFFLHGKILSLFILASAYLGYPANSLLSVFLMFHYFFWFIYPVYKMHKYRREERDGMIMMLVLIVAGSAFFAITKESYGREVYDIAVRTFLIGTVVHILATAPFGYLFGLSFPKHHH